MLGRQWERQMCRVSTQCTGRAAEGSNRAGTRQPLLLEPGNRLGGQDAPGRASVDTDVPGLVCLQQLTIHGGDIFARRREFELRRLPVRDGNDLDLPKSGNWNGLQLAAGSLAPLESPAVEIDQDTVPIPRADPTLRGDYGRPHA